MKITYKNGRYDIRDSLITSEGEFRLVITTNLEECVGCAFIDEKIGCQFSKNVHSLSCVSVSGGIYMSLTDIIKNERRDKLKKIFNG